MSASPQPPDILFYSDFPLGYHNREAEEKMARFAARGHRVIYVEQLGIRNPSVRHFARLARTLAGRGAPQGRGQGSQPFEVISPKLLPPRHAPVVDPINRRWLARQLLRPLENPSAAICWVRYPTPELIAVLDAADPRLVIYEQVDDHVAAAGLPVRLRSRFRRAEDEVLARAALVFAWSEPLAEKLSGRHQNVVLATAACDLDRFTPLATQPPDGSRVVAYTGSLDARFDVSLVRGAAERLPAWRFVLAGPVLDQRAWTLSGLPNVELLGPLPAHAVPAVIESATVCLMPYRRTEFAENLFPIKLVEYLAAGRAVVSTPVRAVREFADVVATASTAAELAAAIAAAADDSTEKRLKRAQRAQPFSWETRIDDMESAIWRALGDG